MKVIFLDIDGVVTSLRCGYYNMDIYVVNFLRWVCEKSGSKIVISSTWRHNHGRQFWLNIFGECVHEDFKTPYLVKRVNGIYQSSIRGDEIKEWLDRHSEVVQYLIIDDDADMTKEQLPNLIRTDTYDGMKFSDMEHIMYHLKVEAHYPQDAKLYQHECMFATHNLKSTPTQEPKN